MKKVRKASEKTMKFLKSNLQDVLLLLGTINILLHILLKHGFVTFLLGFGIVLIVTSFVLEVSNMKKNKSSNKYW